MAEAATSVTLVTTDGPAGRFGVTVSAFASVSADPPMLLACINRKSPAAAAIAANGGYCVNVLSAAQSFLADVFAGRSERFAPYDFGSADWQRADGGWRLLELDRVVRLRAGPRHRGRHPSGPDRPRAGDPSRCAGRRQQPDLCPPRLFDRAASLQLTEDPR